MSFKQERGQDGDKVTAQQSFKMATTKIVQGQKQKPEKKYMHGNQDMAGKGLADIVKAIKKYPNDPHRQIFFFAYENPLIAAVGNKREVSKKTRNDFYKTLSRGIDELRSQGMPIRNMTELGQKHIIKLVQKWCKSKQMAATITTKISCYRKFFSLIGKPQTIPTHGKWRELLSKHGVDSNYLERSLVATQAKSWEANNVDLEKVISLVNGECLITGIQMELQSAFGLRVMESLQIEPEISDIGNNKLYVYRGTKGGKGRHIEFDNDLAICAWQRDVLERAKVIAKKHPKRRLALAHIPLENARNHYYYVLKKCGISKLQLGVTSHGLRHGFAARKYEEMTGSRPPVENPVGLLNGDVSTGLDDQSRLDISQQLGHWRKSVTSAYLGSTVRLAREAKSRIKTLVGIFEGNPLVKKELSSAGVNSAWLTGKAALGAVLSNAEKIGLVVSLQTNIHPGAVIANLEKQLNQLVARGVSLTVHFGEGQPDGCLALNLESTKQMEEGV